MKTFQRTDRVGDLLQKELAIILQAQSRDGYLPMITVSAVAVSRDLAHAKVYISTLGETEDIKEIVKTLNQMAAKLRYALAQVVRLRSTPQLQFIYDKSIVYGNKLSALIDAVDPDKLKDR